MAPDQAFRKQQSRFLHAGHTLLSKQACVAEEGPHSKSEMYELSARALPAEATQTMSPFLFQMIRINYPLIILFLSKLNKSRHSEHNLLVIW